MTPTGIKNIIFDFGAVLLNINYRLTCDAFKQLGFDIDAHFGQLKQDETFDLLETGKITPQEFYNALRNLTGYAHSNEVLENAWNAMLLDLPAERVHLLERLQGRYRIFLLSNTNSIHASAFWQTIEQQVGLSHWHGLFEKVYYSHEIGLRKPHAEVYEFVLRDAGLLPHETLFIDDTPPNLTAPAALGIHTRLLDMPVTAMLADF
jgi:putative hydrolase of the HAD superfamily